MHSLILRVERRITSFYTNRIGVLVRKMTPPKLPMNPSGEVLVHIGCGELNDKRFINIDARPFQHVHEVSNNITLNHFSDSSVDLIYACHVLEHISHQTIHSLLASWHSKLKRGGIARISVPDFDRIIEIYNDNNKDISVIQNPLMGGQDYATNFHMIAFNFNYLKTKLEESGFKLVRTWDPKTAQYHSFDDWSSRFLSIKGKNYAISLNIEAVK